MTAARYARALGLALALGGALWLIVGSDTAKPVEPLEPQAIAITAKQIPLDRDAPEERRFGKLIWLGTLELASPSPHFGGYSGIAVDKTGARLAAVSDTGTWLTAEIVSTGGKPAKLVDAKVGPLRGLGGKELRGKAHEDAEGLTFAEAGMVTGEAYVSFERTHRIAAMGVTAEGFGPARRHLQLPADARSATANGGIEALTVMQAGPAAGAILAFTEDYVDDAGNHVGWLIGGEPGKLTLKRLGGFAVTDVASLPGGDIAVLERRFRFTEGVKMRIRRVKAADVRPGALLEGEVLFEADGSREIDNMEGIAAHRDGDGRTILTVISDDNFNPHFQRTLLMRFALAED